MLKFIKCGRNICYCKKEIKKIQSIVPINNEHKKNIEKQINRRHKAYCKCFCIYTMTDNAITR